MSDLWEAYQFIQRSNSVGKPTPNTMSLLDFQVMSAEAMAKAFLAQRQGITGDISDINEKYEIRMELVQRKHPVDADVLKLSTEIAKKLGL